MIGAEITEYFGKSLYNSLWLALAENRLDDAIKEIKLHKTKDGSRFNLFSKSNPVIEAASIAFSSKALNTFTYRRLFINEDDIKEFNDLIRLLVAIHLNGQFKANEKVLVNAIFEILDYLVADVRDSAGGYPKNPISGIVWFGGTWLRSCCSSLAYYCDLSQDVKSKIKALDN